MSPALRAILSTPHSLVSDGRFALGAFKAPFERVNPLDARLGALWPWPRWLKKWRLIMPSNLKRGRKIVWLFLFAWESTSISLRVSTLVQPFQCS